jgi:hypothetical protein
MNVSTALATINRRRPIVPIRRIGIAPTQAARSGQSSRKRRNIAKARPPGLA